MIESEGEPNPLLSALGARLVLCGRDVGSYAGPPRGTLTLAPERARMVPAAGYVGAGTGRKNQILVAGVTVNAKRAVMQGGRQIANLAGRFARDKLERSDHDILSTLATSTEFLVSGPVSGDLESGSWSFAELRQKPTTVYIVLPPQPVQDKRSWTRLLMTPALCEHLKTGPVRTLFILDEFRVAIGHLPIVNDLWALVRGYGVQFLPVLSR